MVPIAANAVMQTRRSMAPPFNGMLLPERAMIGWDKSVTCTGCRPEFRIEGVPTTRPGVT
jgi:hypothetical protein